MSKYSKSNVMKGAWRMFRELPWLTWSKCLKNSWEIEKEIVDEINPKALKQLINGLKSFNRFRSSIDNKPMLSGTREHFKLLNSKTGRRLMRLPEENESRQMVEQGILFPLDIIHQRRKESNNFPENKRKIKKIFRNKIINLEHCVPINIKEYVNNNRD